MKALSMRIAGLALLAILLATLLLDRLFPVSALVERQGVSQTVLDRSGLPLRAFPNRAGLWRWSVPLEDIDEQYIETLLAYEDRYFWHHPGVNPLSLARALYQCILAGRVVSGGSTLTMQVARLLDPHRRSLGGKLKQMLRALQLEAHYSKREILQLYVDLAPFGGILQGVGAASYAYLGKPPTELSVAEAALLTVLPQRPSRLRLDRHPAQAQKARDKVLNRLHKRGLISEAVWQQAKLERVALAPTLRLPMEAPLASRRLTVEMPGQPMIRSTLDGRLQSDMAWTLQDAASRLPARTSLAALIVHNRTGQVLAYQGSADFHQLARYGHVDMISAVRSPGSTLKPFVYGLALERELVHSHSLLLDVPMSYRGYRPENYLRDFRGAATLSEAMQMSLNTTAVQVLHLLGPDTFYARMRSAGVLLRFPVAHEANLSMVVGGVGTTLWHLVEAYTALAPVNRGQTRSLTLVAPEAEADSAAYLLAPGASQVVNEILASAKRPVALPLRHGQDTASRMAWKTGTSYGGRDAWSLGVLPEFTMGVWVGQPNGEARNGLTGSRTALPILFQLEALARQYQDGYVRKTELVAGEAAPAASRHQQVTSMEICWPLGLRKDQTPDGACHQAWKARLIDGVAPPTPRFEQTQLNVHGGFFWRTAEGTRVSPACRLRGLVQKKNGAAEPLQQQAYVIWPSILTPWLPASRHGSHALPDMDDACMQGRDPLRQRQANRIHFRGIQEQNSYKAVPGTQTVPFAVQALGTVGQRWWFLNGDLLEITGEEQPLFYELARPGAYRLTVIDSQGRSSQIHFRVVL